MSPLIAAPNRGYADYQRTENYDTGVLWNESTGLTTSIMPSPTLDVSRSAYLGGFIACTTGITRVDLQWTMDAAQQVYAGGRSVMLSVNIVNLTALRLPNLGPFLQIIFNPISGGQYNGRAQIMGTNRVHPLEFIPIGSPIVNVVNQALAANSVTDFYPTDYYSGPLKLMASPDQAGSFYRFQQLTTAGLWQTVDFMNPLTTNAPNGNIIIAPPNAWRVEVVAGGVVTNLTMAAVHSMTGAS